MASWFSCKNACTGSDPTQDTVKVDISACERPDKENVKPAQFVQENNEADEALKQKLADARRKDAEEQAKRRKEEEAAKMEAAAQAQRLREELAKVKAAEKLAQEKQRADEIKAQHVEAEAAAAAAAAAAEELRARQEQQAAEEQARREEQEAQCVAELAAAEESVTAWCKKNGFRDMNTPKKTMRGATKFPLHTAVKHQNDEMVGLLLKCGVDQHVQDSKKQSPRGLAIAINKNGSHEQILAMLQ